MTEAGAEQRRFREAIEAMADEDLLRMVTATPGEYTPLALELAQQEASRRGGIDVLRQRVSAEASRDQALDSAAATREVESRPWKKVLYGAAWCLGGGFVVATTPAGRAEFILATCAILFGAIQLLRGLVQAIWFRPSGTYIDPSDPLWQEASRRARDSISTLRALAAEYPGQILVKFPLVTAAGEREHVWGELREITGSAVRTTVETVPIAYDGKVPDEVTTPLAELLDWHLELPDGTVRGSFTTQAEIVIRERLNLALPRRVAAVKGKFVDRLGSGRAR